jgi:hypothetical protein
MRTLKRIKDPKWTGAGMAPITPTIKFPSEHLAARFLSRIQPKLQNNPDMKRHRNPLLIWLLAVFALQFPSCLTHAQTKVIINAFNNSNEVTVNNGNPWGNWFGTAYYQVLWDSSDASNNVNSGSMQIQTFFPDSGIGGCCGPQFVVYNQNNGISPALTGNGGNPSAAVATNVEFDIKFDPISFYDTNNGVYPAIEVGTRGVDFNQHDFGTLSGALAIGITNAGWVHVSMPIAASANWTNIPDIYFKYFNSSAQGWLNFWVDNIVFDTAPVPIVPPTMRIEKAERALRVIAAGPQFRRSQLVATDTNQSWVGGTYPVTYSFDIGAYDVNPPINEFHVFWIPTASIQGGAINEFTDFSTGSNLLTLHITGGAAGTAAAVATVDWKTNLINANNPNVALRITNNTAKGRWAVTFNSANTGTLTAPGAAPAAFSLPSDAAATFANPLAFLIGLQPNPIAAIGQHLDLLKVQTTGVATPGSAINFDFTTASSLAPAWGLAATENTNTLVLVTNTTSWWIGSTYPDYGAALATAPSLSGPWKTPSYYTSYDTNGYYQTLQGNIESRLVPAAALPTIDGNSNSVKSADAFFRLQLPPPTE